MSQPKPNDQDPNKVPGDRSLLPPLPPPDTKDPFDRSINK